MNRSVPNDKADPHYDEFKLRCLQEAQKFNDGGSAFSMMAAYQQLVRLRQVNGDSFQRVLNEQPEVQQAIRDASVAIEDTGGDTKGIDGMFEL